MTFKKRATKSIALALISVTVSGSILNSVYAYEQSNMNEQVLMVNDITENELNNARMIRSDFNEETNFTEVFSEEQVKLFKVEFQKENGIEDKFNIVEETEETILETNGARGIMRYTDKKTGDITTLNLFESIDKLHEESIKPQTKAPSRPSSWKTQGPDVANIKVVKGSSRDSITVTHPTYGGTKKYTKPTNSWYTGNTKGYYDNVQDARQSWGTAKKYAGAAAGAAITVIADSILAAGDWKISPNEVIKLLKKSGTTILSLSATATYLVAYIGEIYQILGNYYNI